MNVSVYDMKIKSGFSLRAGTILMRMKIGLMFEGKIGQVDVCFVFSVVHILKI